MLQDSNIIQNQTDHLNEEIAIQCLKDKNYSQLVKKIFEEKKTSVFLEKKILIIFL